MDVTSHTAWRAIVALAGVALAAFALSATAARSAPTCDTSWASAVDGDWEAPENWDQGVPDATKVACITVPGTYSVIVKKDRIAKGLVLGAASGKQTLRLNGFTNAQDIPVATQLSLGQDSTIGPNGILDLTTSGVNPGQVVLLSNGHTITNSGLIRSQPGAGAARLIGASVHNVGTVQINTDTCECFAGTWENEGTLSVAAGKRLTFTGVPDGATVTQSGGTLAATGNVRVINGVFNFLGGDITGTEVDLCATDLNAPGPGSASFHFLRDTSASCSEGRLIGDVGPGVDLRLAHTDTFAMPVTLTKPVTNAGDILVQGAGPVSLLGDQRLTNTGSLTINGTGARIVELNMLNRGAVTVGPGVSLKLNGRGFTQEAGALNLAGALLLVGGSFVHDGGPVTGTPVRLCGTTLEPGGAGASTFDFVRSAHDGCEGGAIAGDIGADEIVRLDNHSDPPLAVALAGPLTSAGTIVATGTGGGVLSGGSLTSTGTITTVAGSALRRTGAFRLAGGTVTNAGTFLLDGGAVTHDAGSTSGQPLELCGSALDPGGSGTAAFDFVGGCAGGAIAGDIAAGEAIRIFSADTGSVAVALAQDLVNRGHLTLGGTGDGRLTGGRTLTNEGTFATAGSGERTLDVALVNLADGTVSIATDACQCAAQAWSNAGSVTVAAGKTLASHGSLSQSSGTLDIAGTLDLAGPLAMAGGVLRGTGTVAAVGGVTNSGGTVRPGSSPGVLSITGDYTQAPGAQLAIQVAGSEPGAGYSRLAVSGTATLAGALSVTTTAAPAAAPRILTATSRTGAFSPVALSGRLYTVAYDATGVLLSPIPRPQSTAAPAITGTPAAGNELTCSQGTWSGGPTSFAREWRRDGTAIPGATQSVYTVVADDQGRSLTCVVSATNDGGTQSRDSAGVAVPVPPPPPEPPRKPVSTAPPMVTGAAATVFSGITCSPGTWTESPTAFAYQWLRDGVPVEGAATPAYTVAIADAGRQISCAVLASNADGAADTGAFSPAVQIARICLVPELSRASLRTARRRLIAAGCALGTVTRPKKVRKGATLVVRGQRVRGGTVKAERTAIGVTLAAKRHR